MKIYTTQQTASILEHAQSIMLSNNGYSRFAGPDWLADALRIAGFVVFRSTDLHGSPCWFGSTKCAQESLSVAPYGVSTYRAPVRNLHDGIDYEELILARQERDSMYD